MEDHVGKVLRIHGCKRSHCADRQVPPSTLCRIPLVPSAHLVPSFLSSRKLLLFLDGVFEGSFWVWSPLIALENCGTHAGRRNQRRRLHHP